jgi:hypothetical protein
VALNLWVSAGGGRGVKLFCWCGRGRLARALLFAPRDEAEKHRIYNLKGEIVRMAL